MSKPLRLLYILAPSFSGSTLLTYLLARHPEIATIGELQATTAGVDSYRCSCGEPIAQCAFWIGIAEACRGRGMAFDVHDFGTALPAGGGWRYRLLRANVRPPPVEWARALAIRLWPGAREDLAAFLERNYALSQIITEIQGGSIFLDGSKSSTRLLHFLESGLWDVRVIHLKRDGRGVAASMAGHGKVPFETAAEYWHRSIRSLENMRRRLDATEVFDMKYEELCSAPADELRELFAWLGVESISIDENDFKRGGFHILGNKMRLNGMSAVRLDEGWRTRVDVRDQEVFMRRYGAVQARLGYIADERAHRTVAMPDRAQ